MFPDIVTMYCHLDAHYHKHKHEEGHAHEHKNEEDFFIFHDMMTVIYNHFRMSYRFVS